VTAGTHVLLFFFVAALADQQEGQERGWVLQAAIKANALLERVSLGPTQQVGLALALTCIMYRFMQLWVSFMDFLDLLR
jgi:hypothetical protein